MAYFRGRALEMEEKAEARLRIRNVRGKGQGSSLVRVKTYSVQMFSTRFRNRSISQRSGMLALGLKYTLTLKNRYLNRIFTQMDITSAKAFLTISIILMYFPCLRGGCSMCFLRCHVSPKWSYLVEPPSQGCLDVQGDLGCEVFSTGPGSWGP